MALQDMPYLVNVHAVGKHPLLVTLPDGSAMKSTHEALLAIPELPLDARKCHLFPALNATGSLLSIGTLCDHGCIAIYDKDKVTIQHAGKMILHGNRSSLTRLWTINIAQPQVAATAAAAVMHHGGGSSTHDTVAFLHAALGSPATSTMITAIEKGYIKFPHLSANTVRQHRPNSIATAKGHLDQTRQGQRSTKSALHHAFNDEDEITGDIFPVKAQSKSKRITTKSSEIKKLPTGNHYTDQSGRFPAVSTRGYEYILHMYSEDGNYIHSQPMKNRKSQSYMAAYDAGNAFFKSKGFTPLFEHLDNETSAGLEKYCKDNSIAIQYVAPHQHRANRAERAIRTFKNHFIAMLSATDPEFPLDQWDLLLPQAEMTVNMLRGSNVNPYISAYQQLHGEFNFESTPLAPPGIKVLVHEKSAQRGSWSPHGVEGWYVGPAMQHYRCYDVLVKTTLRVRTSDTLSWHPHRNLALPGARPVDILAARMDDLSATLSETMKVLPALMSQRDILSKPAASLAEALTTLRDIFGTPQSASNRNDGEQQRVVAIADAGTGQRVRRVEEPTQLQAPAVLQQETIAATEEDSGDPNSITQAFASPPSVHNNLAGEPSPVIAPQPLPKTSNQRRKQGNLFRRRSGRTKKPESLLPPRAPSTVQKKGGKRRKETPQATYKLRNRQLAAAAMDIHIAAEPTNYRAAMYGPDRDKWLQAHSEEINRLVETTQCMQFIPHGNKPRDRTASYYNPQVKVKVKDGQLVFRVRGTYGGDKSDYNGRKDAQTAALSTVKILLNSVVSDEDAEWMTAEISDFYITKGNTLTRPEYMWIPLKTLPEDVIVKYNLRALQQNGKVMVRIDSAIYGLKQAGRISQERLIKHLAEHGYIQCPNTPCIFKHAERPVTFALVVDDFGIKYTGKENAEHLLDVIRQLYRLTVDWKGERYIGMTINHDRVHKALTISMPNYIKKTLNQLEANNMKGAHSPAIYVPPAYGSRKQQQPVHDTSAAIVSTERKKRIQRIVGKLLYYARAVDPTMLTAINKVASSQATPTEAVERAANRLLQYAKQYPNASIVFHASDMILYAHSDASYLSETQARSRAGAVFYLGMQTADNNSINGSVDSISSIIPSIVSSAAEAEYGGLFYAAQTCASMRVILEDMGYPQPKTRIYCDNKCAVGIATGETKQRLSKAFDMKFHWLRDRVQRGQFETVWAKGSTNLADIFTKALSVAKHLLLRSKYVQDQ